MERYIRDRALQYVNRKEPEVSTGRFLLWCAFGFIWSWLFVAFWMSMGK